MDEDHPPAGPYAPIAASNLVGVPTWQRSDRLVLTPYFYWYDVFSGEHLVDIDGTDALTDHPPTLTGFSYRSTAWHRQQLADMAEAGVDILLPVFWGEPGQRIPGRAASDLPWSYAGLPPLVNARDREIDAGHNPPRIGLFYDTSTLTWNTAGERVDLTTERGRHWFYETVRDFFSLIPPRHWAMIDGRPVVFLYSASFAKAYDEELVGFLNRRFAADFGGTTPYLVREVSWNLPADDVYAWGGATGLRRGTVSSLGPGYDHSAVPGREPLVVPRENGAFFERQWLAFLRRPSLRVMVETWNEFHEGTEIAHSREYGRLYITLTRRFADRFRAGILEPGPYTGAHAVEIRLGDPNVPSGLEQLEGGDGLTQPALRDGSACRITAPNPHGPRYLYLRAEDSFKAGGTAALHAVVEYLDVARGTLSLEFDGSDPAAPFQGAYSASAPVTLSGSGQWRTAVFPLTGARLWNSQNHGADLRLAVGTLPLPVRRVQLVRPGLRAVEPRSAASLRLEIYSPPGVRSALEASTDLRAWREIALLQPFTIPALHQLDDPSGSPHRFLRLQLRP